MARKRAAHKKKLAEKYPPSEPCACAVCLSYCARPGWWRDLFHSSGLLNVECCYELEDADAIYEELVWY